MSFGYQLGILKLFRYLILLLGLSVAAWSDVKSKRIPNRILQVLFMLRSLLLVPECLGCPEAWINTVLSALGGIGIGGGFFLLLYLAVRGGIGAGDVKLYAVLGYYLGKEKILTAVLLSFACAALYCLWLLIGEKTELRQKIPLAPFAAAGTILALLSGR